MELGIRSPIFTTFGSFCEQAREFPHVLPHKFTASLEGYYATMGDRFFIIMRRYSDPDLPHFTQAYELGLLIQELVYPHFEGPVGIFRANIRSKMPRAAWDEIGTMYTRLRNYLGVEERQMIYNYLSAAADRLTVLKTENLMKPPERKPLRDIKPYVTLSERAGTYISKTTHISVDPVPGLVNAIKGSTLRTPAVPFPRLPRFQETVRYDEVDKPKVEEI